MASWFVRSAVNHIQETLNCWGKYCFPLYAAFNIFLYFIASLRQKSICKLCNGITKDNVGTELIQVKPSQTEKMCFNVAYLRGHKDFKPK